MIIKIREIPDSGLELRVPLGRGVIADALTGLEADLDRSHAEASLTVIRTGDNVFVHGRIAGEVQVPCVRCLREVATGIETLVRMSYLPEGEEPAEGAEGEAPAEQDVEYATHDGSQIEIADVLRESLILAVPMTPLCRADCKGLCPACGADKNERDCGCVIQMEDPRLAPLKDLKLH